MIKKESLISLLVKVGIAADETKAKELVEATDEQEVTLPDTTKIFTAEAYSKLTENLKTDGIKAGKEIAIKDLKEKTGLEFEGKNPDKFIEEFKAHVAKEAGTSVDEKVKSRDKTIVELKTALQTAKDEKDAVIREKTQIQKDTSLMRLLPKNRDDRFSDQMYLTSIKSEYEFTEEEGKPVVKKNGEVMKDDQFNPVTYESVISKHFTDAKWIKEEGEGGSGGAGGQGGRGGGNKGGGAAGTFLSMSEFTKNLEEKGIHPGSEQATHLLQEALKTNPQMDMNK